MVTRRTLLASAAVSPLLTVPSIRAQEATPPKTIVLVHGAWAGAWIWEKLIPLLRAAGHDVYASTATGMGDRVHLADAAIDLDLYVTDIVNLLEFENLTNVILVGWGYGGMTVTGVAERAPERLAQLIYLDAFVPTDGQNFHDFLQIPDETRTDRTPFGEVAGKPGFWPVWTDFVRSLTKDPADLDWLLAKLAPQPFASLDQPVRLENPAAADVPRTFLLCTEGKGPAEDDWSVALAERVKNEPGWRYAEIADNHLAPVNAPEATAEALLSLV